MSWCSTPTGGVVVFDYAGWQARYPELSAWVSQQTAQQYFNEAQLYLNNTPCSPVQDWSVGGQRSTILNMITAHICALNAPLNGQASSTLVGRISDATEGSVSVSSEYPQPESGTAAWWLTTKYGAAAYQALAPFRTMHYLPGINPPADPWQWLASGMY